MIQSCRCRSQSRNGCFLLPRPASEVNPGIFNQRRPFEQPFQGRSFLVCEPLVFQLERLTEDFQKFLYPIAGGLHGLSDFLYHLIGRRSIRRTFHVVFMGFAYIVKDSVPCFMCHMAEKIFFLYLTGFQNFQGTVCGGFGMFFQYHCPDSGQRHY